MSPALEVRDVFRVYSTPEGDAAALQGISLSVRRSELVAVLGPSGSGKTTLLRLLAGLDRPSAGTVRVFDVDIGRLPARRRAAYRATSVGYVDQHYSQALSSELTAADLVALPLGLRGLTARERRLRADELLERVGLLDRRAARPGELSGGEQQRVAVCAGLAHRPRLLLADEPTGELDAENAGTVFRLIAELAREHDATTVVVSHDPRAATVADRIVQIRDGRVAEETVRGAARETGEIVVGRGGWLRLPEEYLRRARIGSRANARIERETIVLSSTEQQQTERERPASAERGGAPQHARADGTVAEARSVAKRFGSGRVAREVFVDFDAAFAAGRFYALTGPSGSGKTTLLHILAGLELPTDGSVVVDGTTVSELGREARARFRAERVGLVTQDPGLIPFLSARENVELALALNGDHRINGRALEVLDAVGLSERVEQRVSRLSTGERGRVAIARALAPRPALLLADEPTSRLDEANGRAVALLLAALARESGAAVVCATHDPLVIEQADEELPLGLPATKAPLAVPPSGRGGSARSSV
jgi:ABC-type lipoprotein export system ATPase subunit